MNAHDGLNPRGVDAKRPPRVEAAGAVDAQTASTHSLENAPNAFSTAPTRKVIDMIQIKNLLPRSPDRSVT